MSGVLKKSAVESRCNIGGLARKVNGQHALDAIRRLHHSRHTAPCTAQPFSGIRCFMPPLADKCRELWYA